MSDLVYKMYHVVYKLSYIVCKLYHGFKDIKISLSFLDLHLLITSDIVYVF